MEEAVFFDVNRVLVSNARFIVEGKTYSMNAVTSVRTARERPARSGPLAVLAIGLFCVLTGDANGIMLGVFALALGVLWWFKQKPTWRVLLTTSARETVRVQAPCGGGRGQSDRRRGQPLVQVAARVGGSRLGGAMPARKA